MLSCLSAAVRACIGTSFAVVETQIVMAPLLECFRFGVEGEEPVLPRALLTMFPSREPTFNLQPAGGLRSSS